MYFVSYAQNHEDVFLNRVFGGQETGFYVDVGAYHPVDGSVTKALYDRGWSGINVEPGPVHQDLVTERPRDVNLRMAVLDYKGDVSFFEDETDRGMSQVDGGTAGGRSVPCDTLENIVRDHAKGRPVDFIKVDAEGAEAAIVRSTNWRNLRPRLLIFEATRPWSTQLANADWEPVLLEQGYVRAYFDGINCFYVPEEEWVLLQRHFMAPVNVLDRVMRYDQVAADRYNALAAHHEAVQTALIGERDTLLAERVRSAEELNAANAERNLLKAERTDLIQAIGSLENRISSMAVPQDQDSGLPLMAQIATPPRRRGALRSIRHGLYVPIRPIARSLGRRLRNFMTMTLHEEFADIRSRQDALRREVSALYGAISPELREHLARLRRDIVTELREVVRGKVNGDDELRRLAKEINDALLALTLEAFHATDAESKEANSNT